MAAGIYYEEGKHIIAASIAMAAVDVLAVAMKFWVRLSFKQPLKADDWLLVPATVRPGAHPSSQTLLHPQGLARPMWTSPVSVLFI
jgi:hypothetical protein